MWKKYVAELTTKHHCQEKHDCYVIAYI